MKKRALAALSADFGNVKQPIQMHHFPAQQVHPAVLHYVILKAIHMQLFREECGIQMAHMKTVLREYNTDTYKLFYI